MNQEDVLRKLDQLADEDGNVVLQPELLEELVAHGEAIAPALLERITDDALRARNQADPCLDNIAYMAIFALCELVIPTTVEPLFHACFVSGDEDILEWLDSHLWRFGSTAIPLLEQITSNESIGWYPRAVALDVLNEIALDSPEAQEFYKAFLIRQLTELLDQGGEPEDDYIASLVSRLTDFRDPEARPLINRAFAEDRVDRGFIVEKNVEAIYSGSTKVHVATRSESFLVFYKSWYARHELEGQEAEARRVREALKESQRMIFQGRPAPPPSKKPGRNDPCWCGSGKKYKKCHLDKDQGR